MTTRLSPEHEDKPYLEGLIRAWGMDKLEIVSRYPRSAIYQWKPSRVGVPAEAALRICELPEAEDLGFYVERLCPTLPWHLLYAGRDRRKSYEGLRGLMNGIQQVDLIVKHVGVTEVSRAAGRSRQNIYDAMKAERCPVWLALAIEQASEQCYLVEDLRPELPWWPLYRRHEKVVPVKAGVSKRAKANDAK